MRIIGLAGKAGTGKTTFAKHAISVFGGTKIALGDAVKEEAAEFLDSCLVAYEQQHLYGTQDDKAEIFSVLVGDWLQTDYRLRKILNPYTEFDGNSVSMSYRQLLQLWGTEYRRAQKESYWADKGKEKILATEGLIFVDDIRFPDEAEMIQDLGGVLIRIERPGGPFISTPDHPSETSLDGCNMFNWTLFNGGSLDEFKAEVEKLMRWVV
ncbi:MAG TPA: hypothetical protein DCS07_12815 [Bdellovibrionales bacterium]|nr:hypothetical protein [Bdellovibrionales bacterium]